jgi:hypothetical protein
MTGAFANNRAAPISPTPTTILRAADLRQWARKPSWANRPILTQQPARINVILCPTNRPYHSRQHVEKPVKTGSGSRGTRPGGAESIGKVYGDHITNKDTTGYRGPKFHNDKSFQPVKFGNEVALNVGKGGCGTGRTLYGQAGSQGTHGAVNPGNPRPHGRGILNNE